VLRSELAEMNFGEFRLTLTAGYNNYGTTVECLRSLNVAEKNPQRFITVRKSGNNTSILLSAAKYQFLYSSTIEERSTSWYANLTGLVFTASCHSCQCTLFLSTATGTMRQAVTG